MLAFICFWTYIAFSQFMLIWIAGLPEEIPFYITRFKRGLGVGRRGPDLRALLHPVRRAAVALAQAGSAQLAGVAVWILLIHYVDIYWLVMPTLHPDGFAFHWTNSPPSSASACVAIAFGVWRLRGKLPVPVKDPYLADSLRYRQP